MPSVTIGALDTIELAEILEYFMALADVLAEHDFTRIHFARRSPYGLDDLRADVTRLIDRSHTTPLRP